MSQNNKETTASTRVRQILQTNVKQGRIGRLDIIYEMICCITPKLNQLRDYSSTKLDVNIPRTF